MVTAKSSAESSGVIGPVLALDLGKKRVGVAVSDELLITVNRGAPLKRTNWKQLLRDVSDLVHRFDATSVVVGLPLTLAGEHGSAAEEVRGLAEKFALSLGLPVYLQDERLTSREAEEQLRAEGIEGAAIHKFVDSEAATIILRDFIARLSRNEAVSPLDQ